MNNKLQRRSFLMVGGAIALLPMTTPSSAAAAPAAPEKNLAARYLEAWRSKDIEALARVVGEQIRFVSPTASSTGRPAYLAAATKFFPLYSALTIRAIIAEPGRAMVAYDLNCVPPIGACPTAELLTIADGLIVASDVYFDARPFAALAQRAGKQ
jgi:hypothetical protein